MNRMNRAMTLVAGVGAALVLAATTGAATASAATATASPDAGTVQVAADMPFFLWGTYYTQMECSQVGHNLVNRGPYASYMCPQVLGGWQLWVREY
ncbi:hypothetical protein EDD93_5119 [Streptomyces sp. 840.1]|uniref:hypothetical protein n=1 Tax=Streptomyces sp. 840.1 TaxID=2485152 RepID=UPI000F477841|nr:hypothetical protein [Streptomyces sp. 840.1]ROQ70595.1 hypothetical protein EDD93_5119 [Streptomyces sp. 840.1]